jgi:hypothetical protein
LRSDSFDEKNKGYKFYGSKTKKNLLNNILTSRGTHLNNYRKLRNRKNSPENILQEEIL